MSKAPISKFLSLLSRHSDLIEQVYHEDFLVANEELDSTVRLLHQERILYLREDDEFGLASSVRDMLDEYTQRVNRYEAGGNVVAEIERLDKLLDELELSIGKSEYERLSRLRDDVVNAVYDVREVIEREVLKLDRIMESEFSDVKDVEEKARHNAYYNKKANALLAAFEMLWPLTDRFSRIVYGDVGRVYTRAIIARTGDWMARLQKQNQVFERFMFKFREIEQKTKRLRLFSDFLNDGGDSKLHEVLEISNRVPALMRVLDKPRLPFPNIYADDVKEVLSTVVADFKPIEKREERKKKVGVRRKDDGVFSEELQLSVQEKLIEKLITDVDKSSDWVSAGNWARTQDDAVDVPLFLEYILVWEEIGSEGLYEVEPIMAPGEIARSSTRIVEDVRLCRAH